MIFDTLAKRGTDFLGVKYPIMAGAMTWVSDIHLVKAVSKEGAFGVLAGGNMPPELFEKEVDKAIAEINGPFAVNMITIAPNYHAHLEIVKSKKVPFVIFAGSFPHKAEVVSVKSHGIRTLAFASEESIAQMQINYGIDALILEGSEAGGHIGHVSLGILLQQVLFKFDQVPIFVAGGIATGKMMAHMMLMGAAGVQLGTRFVMTNECTAHPAFKEVFRKARGRQAIATPQYDSKLPVVAVRAIKNKGTDEFGRLQMKLIKEIEAGSITREKAQFEVESFWVGALRKAVVDGDVENGSLMAGQSVGLIDDILPMAKVIENLVSDAQSELDRVGTLFGKR